MIQLTLFLWLWEVGIRSLQINLNQMDCYGADAKVSEAEHEKLSTHTRLLYRY
jgi:hypothetical protein